MKIKTEKLQKLLTKASKCVGNNNMVPITNLLSLEAKDGKLTITTTDNVNYLYVSDVDVDGDIYVVTEFNNLYKLVSKLTSENIELNIDKNILKISANGKYNLPVVIDDSGEMLKYPNPLKKFKGIKEESLNKDTISKIIKNIKSAVATDSSVPYLANYYVGNSVVASDSLIASKLDESVLKSPKLFSVKLLSLVDLTSDQNIKFSYDDKSMSFVTKDVCVYCANNQNTEDFPIDVINNLFVDKLKSVVEINCDEFMEIIDRATLFTDALLNIKFNSKSLSISTDNGDMEEKIEYVSGSGEKFSCKVDINLLKTQLSNIDNDVISIEYGSDKIIRINFDNISKIIALGE